MKKTVKSGTVMVIDDDVVFCRMIRKWLEKESYAVETAYNGRQCLNALSSVMPDALCLDLFMEGMHGLEILKRVSGLYPLLPVIILTADDKAQTAVESMREGAYDYVVKPVDRMKLLTIIRNAVEHSRMSMRLHHLEREAENRGYPGIVGDSESMKKIYRQMDRVATSDINVLVRGESGTGKEVIAQSLHAASGRRRGPFIPVNCAAIPDTLLESELFGHEKGAFTGAVSMHRGKFEQSNGGSLFLDEISEMPLRLQVKLLRVIQERKLVRLGGTKEIPVDFRLITASQKSLGREVKKDRFRKDLYYRIAVFELKLPPLRDRKEDIPLLSSKFLKDFAPAGKRLGFSPEAMDFLLEHPWPGNVRELLNAVQRAVVVCNGPVILVQDLPSQVQGRDSVPVRDSMQVKKTESAAPGKRSLDEIEKEAVSAALEQTGFNVSEAARILGLSRSTLYRKIKKYALS